MFSPEQADRICNAIANGSTLRQVAESEHISASLIVWNANHSEEFAKQYARSITVRTDMEFEQFVEDAETPAPTVKGFTDTGWVQWQRVRLDARKWALSKRSPKKYGDRTEVTGAGGGPLQTVIQIVSAVPRPHRELPSVAGPTTIGSDITIDSATIGSESLPESATIGSYEQDGGSSVEV